MGGTTVDLNDDAQILSINSPKSSLKGPYCVVHKDLSERWVIVAMEWDKQPRLGMRWFWGNGGNPFSSGNPIWLVIPPTLSKGILASLPLNHTLSTKVDDFLSGKISGNDLVS
jgi:hypothetical protein